ncbi:NFX1-type zinc finger-containing protein 1-like [Antedon mediterranea]|uniref:NFX1-type zinc finger-containing protein 1-like n=1 Tax=Antedon mediterranea TaxID=105859 RepID=UPI003AF5C8D0
MADQSRQHRYRGRGQRGGRGRGGERESASHGNRNPAYRTTERPVSQHDSYGGGDHRRDVDDHTGEQIGRRNSGNQGHDSFGGRAYSRNRSLNRHDPNQNDQGARPKREIRPTGYRRLEELLSKEKEEILMQVLATGFGFQKLLNEDNINRDMCALILRAIVSACECTTARASLNSFLGKLQKSSFIKYVMSHHIMSLKDERSDRVKYEVEIQDIITVIWTLVEKLPSSTHELKASLMLIKITIDELVGEGLIGECFLERYKELEDFFQAVEKNQGENVRIVRRKKINMDEETPPPDDFRTISIFPTLNDLTADRRPYLRHNKLDGSYENVDHYLDVQFRLLREDLVRPLREGIREYLQHKEDKHRRITDIRVYNDVTIEYPVCSHNCILYRVHFDVSRLKGVRWQSTKRLIYGSLVCLSPDDFQTVCFATVANREEKDLENGFLDIKFENDVDFGLNERHYTMVETSSFFEAYRHVLHSLQEITETSMPMRSYIIEARHEVDAPSYLRHNRTMTYDLSPLVDGTTKLLVRIAGNYWPTATALQLDDSQFDAVRTALTKEFAVIQGPPGTGKTYIGLKIVHALLHNSECWTIDAARARVKHSPIFVVCFTNHALDQFLEGIHSFQPTGIVRVGGRSKSETLKSFNLTQLRQKARERKELPISILNRKRDILRDMHALRDVMNLAEERIKVTTTGVIGEIYLETWMSDDHYESLTQFEVNSDNVVVVWLGLAGNNKASDLVVDDIQNIVHDPDEEPTEEENEEMDIAEEADLLTEQRLVDIDDDITGEKVNVKEIDRIKKTVRRQLAYDPLKHVADEDGFQLAGNKKRRSRYLKKQLLSSDKMREIEAARVGNIWNLKLNDRWRLYRFWISKYCNNERQTLFQNQANYDALGKQLQEIGLEEDLRLMRDAKVIGMTTTGAARCRNMLQRIQAKIVIVEEAAEVLEAHIVSSLTEGCEHLILIGDHQQLRPNPTVYNLAKEFKLEISLFERMVKNGMDCQRLNIQHRMRPEISSIMKNYFYTGLLDAPNVLQYGNIKGVSSNMFFIEHNQLETAVNDTLSKSNIFEAEFLVNLCKYLIQQGYKPSEITILTTYTGQLFQFKKIMKSQFFKGVCVRAVDNYQGEENEIILLSLVRSNAAGKIGFLKEKTRMCVALSRAKKGLFCIGNMKLLAAQDENWNKIVKELRQQKLLGPTIRLCCQNHTNTSVEIRELSDFTKCPEGGCNVPCISRLKCGHACKLPCHPYDPEHKEVICREACVRVTCPMGHPCRLKCFQKCEKECKVSVTKCLPCGHNQKVPCFKDVSTVACLSTCPKTLECGHACNETCSHPCTSRCQQIVSKLWPCGHNGEYKCYVDDPLKCSHPCGFSLKCDHTCEGKCGDCKNGRLHQQCRSKCGRTLVCGHECLEPCTRNCPPCSKPCENRCVHSKCPRKCGEECTPCTMPCEWQCEHHTCKRQCGQPCNRDRCNEPCKKLLTTCGHACVGLCGEPCPKKCRICNKKELTTIMFGNEDDPDARFIELEKCGHVIESEALDTWMDEKDEQQNDVQPKLCPLCKTPIRMNLRYGNIIKQLQMDVEHVKAKINGDKHLIYLDKQKLTIEISKISDAESHRHLDIELKTVKTPDQVTDMKNKVQFLLEMQKIKNAGFGKICSGYVQFETKIKKELETCKQWILKPRNRFSEQLLEDISLELQRIKYFMELYVLKSILHTSKISKDELLDYLSTVKKRVAGVKPLIEGDIKTINFCLKKIREKCGSIPGISDDERVQIVKAMGLSKGHWFKCPKGHVYAIGDCGGATTEGKCPECGSNIGGTNYQLREGNILAREMDGASYAAWSEQTNLANYGFNDIF